MTAARIRPIQISDYSTLAATLNSAFSSYRDATVYTSSMLAYFREWMWAESPSLVLSSGDTVGGVLFAGYRTALFQGEELKVLHIGPFGITKDLRRKGWGTQMLRALLAPARASGVDLLTLTTESLYGAHRLYRREGFDSIEAFRPQLLLLGSKAAPASAFDGVHLTSNIRPRSLQRHAPEEDRLVETHPDGPPLPTALHPNRWELEGGHATTVQWSIVSRQGNRETRQKVIQMISWEDGNSPEALFRAVREHSTAQGGTCLYALSGLSDRLPQLNARGSSLVYRMARPLTDRGKRATQLARAYTEIAPAP